MTLLDSEPAPASPDSSPADEAEIAPIVRAVERRLPAVARAQIEALVVSEIARYEDARIRQFVPVLVERAVLTRLRGAPVPTEGSK